MKRLGNSTSGNCCWILNGAYVDLFQMSQEKPVLLYFWASWCPVCKAVTPAIASLRDDHPVVTVALSSGSREQVLSAAREQGVGFPIVNDAHGDIARAWDVRGTPTIAVLYQGRVKSMTSGITNAARYLHATVSGGLALLSHLSSRDNSRRLFRRAGFSHNLRVWKTARFLLSPTGAYHSSCHMQYQ
ncbi:MAG: protein disulfide oxidoreductase [Haliea sp.]|nr:protein disulfide oxidoreductase [Haliea sp.]